MASWTPVIVVPRSATICEIDTFMTLLSRTITNWAAARMMIGNGLLRMRGIVRDPRPAETAGCAARARHNGPAFEGLSSRAEGTPMTSTTTTTPSAAPAVPAAEEGHAPERQGLVLASLIIVAAVANLNLSVANVALPDIGKAFDASQTALDLVAVGYSLGLAASVLWLGALGDRFGRKIGRA